MSRGFLDEQFDQGSGFEFANTRDMVSLAVVFLQPSFKAIQVDAGTRKLWVPKSLLSEETREVLEDARQGQQLEISVAEWFAKKEKLI